MKEILIGIIAGTISSIGMGGGTVLIFLLTMFCNLEQHIAQASNLIFFIPTAITATVINLKNKNIDLKFAGSIIAFGILGAIIGAKISMNTNVNSLRKYFGYFLALIAGYEIYSLIKLYINHKKVNNKITK